MRVIYLLVAVRSLVFAAGPDAQALINHGHWKRARVAAEADYKAHPNDAHAAWLMSLVSHRFQKLDEAVKYAEQAVRLDPKVDAYHRALGEACADIAQKAPVFKQLGYARRIRSEFDTALALAPKDPDNMMNQIMFLLNAPGIMGGDKKKAVEIANEMVKVNPARGYLAMVEVARAQKEEGKEEGLFQKASESDPRNYGAHVNLASWYTGDAHKNLALTEQHARAALELNPDRIGAYCWLALALASEKKFDETAKVLARAEAAVPDDLSPYVYAARGMLNSGAELPKAEAYLQKYLNETKEPEVGAPIPAGVHRTLGLVYEKEGRLPDAKREFETAVRLKPDFEPAKRDLKRMK